MLCCTHHTHASQNQRQGVRIAHIQKSCTYGQLKSPSHLCKISFGWKLDFSAWLPLIWHFVIKNLTVGIRIHKQNNTSRKPSIQKWNLVAQTVWDSRPQSECIIRHSMSGQITLSDGCIFLVCALHSIISFFSIDLCKFFFHPWRPLKNTVLSMQNGSTETSPERAVYVCLFCLRVPPPSEG